MKYWVYLNGEVPGCYPAEELVLLPGFSATTLICPSEGDIQDKNWRRAGEFPDVIRSSQDSMAIRSPMAPVREESFRAANANDFLDSAGAKIFRHVSEIVGEMERFRETKGLVLALQGQLLEADEKMRRVEAEKENLKKELGRISILEESLRRSGEEKQRLESDIQAQQKNIDDLRLGSARLSSDADAAKRRLDDSLKHLGIRNKLVDKLSQDLAEKETSLAKALDVVRKMEGELERLAGRSDARLKTEPVSLVRENVPRPSDEKIRSAAATESAKEIASSSLIDGEDARTSPRMQRLFKKIISSD
ncbi:MAG: hypothetical protein ACYCPQ_09610 [Elusimicrobiota bacterium]